MKFITLSNSNSFILFAFSWELEIKSQTRNVRGEITSNKNYDFMTKKHIMGREYTDKNNFQRESNMDTISSTIKIIFMLQ